jgi:hypothetical protein
VTDWYTVSFVIARVAAGGFSAFLVVLGGLLVLLDAPAAVSDFWVPVLLGVGSANLLFVRRIPRMGT